MPKELKVFQTDFEKLRLQGVDIHAESKSIINTNGHFYGQIKEAAKAIGKRVQELKNQGKQGAAVKDFLGDSEVSQYYTAGLRQVKEAKVNHDRMVANYAQGKIVFNALIKLKKDLLAEAKEREGKLIGKSQSAPEMKKLAATIAKFVEDPPGKLMPALEEMNMAPPKFTLGDDYNEDIKDAIANTADVISREQSEMLDQMMNVRVLTGHMATVKSVTEDLKVALLAITKAIRENKPAEAAAALSTSVKTFASLKATVDPVRQGYASNESWIKDSKDGTKIIAMMKVINENYDAAVKLMIALRAKFPK